MNEFAVSIDSLFMTLAVFVHWCLCLWSVHWNPEHCDVIHWNIFWSLHFG